MIVDFTASRSRRLLVIHFILTLVSASWMTLLPGPGFLVVWVGSRISEPMTGMIEWNLLFFPRLWRWGLLLRTIPCLHDWWQVYSTFTYCSTKIMQSTTMTLIMSLLPRAISCLLVKNTSDPYRQPVGNPLLKRLTVRFTSLHSHHTPQTIEKALFKAYDRM